MNTVLHVNFIHVNKKMNILFLNILIPIQQNY